MLDFARIRNLSLFGLAVLMSSCNGGGGGTVPSTTTGGGTMDQLPGDMTSAPEATASQAIYPNAIGNIDTYPGAVDGESGHYTPDVGNYADGGQGSTVDGIGCYPTMVQDEYHVHIYLGIIYNGKLIANPAGMGMVKPGTAVKGYINSAHCFYRVHMHDSSGIVHIELARSLSELPYSATAPFPLKTILDVWGVPHSATSFGPFSGPIHIYTGNVPAKTLVVSSYQPYTDTMDSIKLRSHEVIWIEIGTKYYTQTQLPSVQFYMEF
jgi:hypothetical protein